MTHTTASHPHVARYRFVQMLRMYYPNASREEIRTWCGWVKPKEQEEGRPTFTPAQVGRRESTVPASLPSHSPPVLTARFHDARQRAEVARLFAAYDADNSGGISLAELQAAFGTTEGARQHSPRQRLRLSRAHPATLETAFLCATGGRAGSHLCIGGL